MRAMKYRAATGEVEAIPLYSTLFQSSWVKIWCTNNKHNQTAIYTYVQHFGVGKIFYVFEISLNLFDLVIYWLIYCYCNILIDIVKTVILWNITKKTFVYIRQTFSNLFLFWRNWNFSSHCSSHILSYYVSEIMLIKCLYHYNIPILF